MRQAQTSVHNVHLIALDVGEPVLESVLDYCRERGVAAASVSGIGAVKDVEIGAYDLARREYVKTRLKGDHELLTLAGNISIDEHDETVFHAHVVLGDAEGKTTGGHLFAGVCAVTVELVVSELAWPIRRGLVAEIGLKLWQL